MFAAVVLVADPLMYEFHSFQFTCTFLKERTVFDFADNNPRVLALCTVCDYRD